MDKRYRPVDVGQPRLWRPGFIYQHPAQAAQRPVAASTPTSRGRPADLARVDGGVRTGNIGTIVAAGADTLVTGGAVFGAPTRQRPAAIMQDLRSAAARPE